MPWLDGDGDPQVKVGGRPVAVHVLVALAWHGKPEVSHEDGDRANPRPVNLRWRSHRENEQKKKETGREEGTERESYPPFPAVTTVTGDLRR